MQNEKSLAPGEALELHELITSEINVYKKLKTNFGKAEDNELKEFMKESMNFKKENIIQLQNFITLQGKLQ
jgi:hypothetical protein